MAVDLTDKIVGQLEPPEKGNRITYDSRVSGFGCRVTANGARSFVVNYRTRGGLERRFTIGPWPAWKAAAARKEAERIKVQVRANGYDPLGELAAEREAVTIADLCKDFSEDVLPQRRESTRRDYQSLIDTIILPAWRNRKVAEITADDVDSLHRKITRAGTSGRPAPYRANRLVAVLSKMFALAVRSKVRSDNPCRGVALNHEEKRQRYLRADEVKALVAALGAHPDRDAADALALLLLTGARRSEVLSAKWADLDLAAAVWTKPGATTKQKTVHRVPLSAAAIEVLQRVAADRKAREIKSEYVFPGREEGHRKELKKDWRQICLAAGIVTRRVVEEPDGTQREIVTPNARIHDLRHSFASHLASAGASLPVIGALLGHTQAATTHRYAHLLDDALRQATEQAAQFMGGAVK